MKLVSSDFEIIKPSKFGGSKNTISISKYGIRFTKDVVESMGYPRYVSIYFSKNRKQLIFMPVAEEAPGARRFYKPNKSKSMPLFNNSTLVKMAADSAKLDINKYSYSFDPEVVEGNNHAVGIDLTKGKIK